MAQSELDVIFQELRARPVDFSVPEADLRTGFDAMGDLAPLPEGVTLAKTEVGGVPAERLTSGSGPIVLYLHGGGYVIGSAKSHRALTSRLAQEIAGEVYALDYRLAPEAPMPAALEDAVAAYAALSAQVPGRPIVLAGDSAGGGLAFATAVAIRDRGLPTPAGVVGISPWVNMGAENESYERLAAADPMLSRAAIDYFAQRYLGDAHPRDPRASPLFADLAGLPPVLIQVGDRECFLGDACSFHQALIAADVDSELRVWKGMFHVWHLYWPRLAQGRDAVSEIAGFIQRTCGRETGDRAPAAARLQDA